MDELLVEIWSDNDVDDIDEVVNDWLEGDEPNASDAHLILARFFAWAFAVRVAADEEYKTSR